MAQYPPGTLKSLQARVTSCRKCPRLVKWRESIARKKTKRFSDWEYWGKPVPSFGHFGARLLVVGLAPAAHGGNRTGRMFTGDESGNWLYRALYKAGFSSQPSSTARNDGLKLHDCYITATCHCAPPLNKLLRKEIINCRPYMVDEILHLKSLQVVIGLGKIGFESVFDCFRSIGWTQLKARPRFGHGVSYKINNRITLIGCYHPSQQNTFTGKLTKQMLDQVCSKAASLLS